MSSRGMRGGKSAMAGMAAITIESTQTTVLIRREGCMAFSSGMAVAVGGGWGGDRMSPTPACDKNSYVV